LVTRWTCTFATFIPCLVRGPRDLR
jgi:hypothetical protein